MKLFFITSNKGKFAEVEADLKDIPDLELERLARSYPEIQADTLDEVVKFALEWLSQNLDNIYRDSYIMIEDSGLFVERLNGFPGVYSAYIHRTIKGYNAVLTLVEGEWDRRARFETRIGLLSPDGEKKTLSGVCTGKLADEPRGSNGFGYDPIFIPEGSNLTFAEMTVEEKNKYSHRGKALEELKKNFRW